MRYWYTQEDILGDLCYQEIGKWKVKVAQSCLTLCEPVDYTVHGILQASILEWVVYSFSRESSQPKLEPRSPALQADSLPAELHGKAIERLLLCIRHWPGEGNSNPLQYSCLENAVDGGAWWAAVYGVVHSRTQLKRLSMHACIGEGNGNALQCSWLENPRDRGAWWAAIYGVAQSRTWLKRFSSSSRHWPRNFLIISV